MDIGSSSMLLLAQLVAPPLQPGPVRLPSSTIEQRSSPGDGPVFEQPDSDASGLDSSEGESNPELTTTSWTPNVVGDAFFTDEQLSTIFKTCRQETAAKTLNNCAAKLTAQLLSEGYINSRVYVLQKPQPGALEVVLGRISEVNVTSTDPALQDKAEQELSGLIGEVLHLPTLESALVGLRKRGFGQISGGMHAWAVTHPVPRSNSLWSRRHHLRCKGTLPSAITATSVVVSGEAAPPCSNRI